MGFKELLVILVIALVVFGTKRLRNIGGDLGGAVKNFKDAMNGEDGSKAVEDKTAPSKSAIKKAPVKKATATKTAAKKPASKTLKKSAPRKIAAK